MRTNALPVMLLFLIAMLCPLFGENEKERAAFTARIERVDGSSSQLILTEHLSVGETINISIPDILGQTRALAAKRVEKKLFIVLQVDEFYIERAVYELRGDAWERASSVRLCGMRSLIMDRIVAASISDDGNQVTISTLPPGTPSPAMDGGWQNQVLRPRKVDHPDILITDTFIIAGAEVKRIRPPNSILPD